MGMYALVFVLCVGVGAVEDDVDIFRSSSHLLSISFGNPGGLCLSELRSHDILEGCSHSVSSDSSFDDIDRLCTWHALSRILLSPTHGSNSSSSGCCSRFSWFRASRSFACSMAAVGGGAAVPANTLGIENDRARGMHTLDIPEQQVALNYLTDNAG